MSSTRLVVLPTEYTAPTNEAQQFLRLPHPRTGLPALFLPSPDGTRVAEVQQIVPPENERRSSFVDASILSDANPYIFTPFDVVFLLSACLANLGKRSLPLSDLFEEASYAWRFVMPAPASKGKGKQEEDSSTMDVEDVIASQDAVRLGSLPCVQRALSEICEITKLSEEVSTYRLDMDKLLPILKRKVQRVAEAVEQFPTLSRALAKEGLMDNDVSDETKQQGRWHVALDMIASCLPEGIENVLRSTFTWDALEAHRAALAQRLEDEAPKAPSTTKHGSSLDTAAKEKKKKEQAAKNKKSRGVSELAKVHTTNGQRAMMSGFFSAKPKS